ncbi:sugar transferase [Asticcacaulis sp. W401b]|uniref:sugar transferase n=1 Tax=Asticcacaulis sp. W401b TaxID=3388666 RepID=UPI003970F361
MIKVEGFDFPKNGIQTSSEKRDNFRPVNTKILSQSKNGKSFPFIRIADVIISLFALIFFLPVFALVGTVIKMQDGGPVLFSQSRIGHKGQEFQCYKFRSMVSNSDKALSDWLQINPFARVEWERDHKLKNDPRITKFGKFLRKTSIDELPQLWNVLKGDMSLVGPRPIVKSEISKYGKSFSFYCSVTPGVTGLWQVSGRNNVSYKRRVALDRLFAKKKSLGVYCKILIYTVPAVLFQKGSY